MLGVLASTLALLCSCTAPAYNESQFRAKAATTATHAVSAVQVARLAVRETARHDLFQNPVDVAISNAEENLSSVAGTFSLVQPPDQDMVSLRDRVLDLVTHAQRQLEAARIAFRQRDIQTAVRAVEKAARDAKALARIAARY